MGLVETLEQSRSILSGLYLIWEARMKNFERDRKAYIVTFPTEMREEQVAAWLTAISRTVKRNQSIVFEVIGTHETITHRLRVPWQHAEDILSQLNTHIPGISAAEDTRTPLYDWTHAIEVGESNKDRPLDIKNGVNLSRSILANFHPLKEGEVLMMQWVISPAAREPLPSNRSRSSEFKVKGFTFSGEVGADELRERREKLSEANVMAVMRAAAKASTEKRAKSLVGRIKTSLKSVESPHNYWTTRGFKKGVLERTKTGASLLVWPAQLNVSEFTGLIGWLGGESVPGMPAGRSKYLAASVAIPKTGRLFGDANMPGNQRPVAVSVIESNKHWHIVGRTGSGKSTLMANLAAQDIHAGRGVVLLDPKFDLFDSVTQYVPANRIDETVILDASDVARPPGFNLLHQGSPQAVASEIQSIFSHIYSADSGAVRMPEVLYHALITLMSTKADGGPYTFVDMIPLLWPETRGDNAFSKAVIDGVDDPYIKAWWSAHHRLTKSERDKYLQPLRARIWQLNSRSEIRNIIGQSESSIDMRDIVANRKILLVNLHGLSSESASLIGSSIVNNLWHAVKEGLSSQENPVSLFLDEFQHFVHSPIAPETMLAEARSFGLSMHLAHQGLDQLAGKRQLEDAVMNNAVNKIVFQRGLKDARTFASEFGSPVTDDDMKKLSQYEFVARVSTETGISPPMTGKTRAPLPRDYFGRQVRAASRLKYGKDSSDVEREIQARRVMEKDDPIIVTGDEELDDEI